jgi:hypothetical protein
VPRLEIPVRTSLRFVNGAVPLLGPSPQAASVVIEFGDRTFGWLGHGRFPHQAEDEPPPGPTVTTILNDHTPDDWGRAAEALQRFLSALAFHYDTRIESRHTKGGSSESDLLHPYGAIEPSDTYGGYLVSAPKRVHLNSEKECQIAVGLYREALAAGSPFYRFLALWNVLEARFDGDETARTDFIKSSSVGRLAHPFVSSEALPDYLRWDSRHAIAHVVRKDRRTIDPDAPQDRERLDLDALILHELARLAVLDRWPDAVTVEL